MKASHAIAVLALSVANSCAQAQSGTGWNLMVPPLTAGGFANQAAPLAQWQNLGTYSDDDNCKAALQQGQFGAGAQFGPITRAQSAIEYGAVEIMSGKCIASDDPRFGQTNPP
jgi:hypothetical protein